MDAATEGPADIVTSSINNRDPDHEPTHLHPPHRDYVDRPAARSGGPDGNPAGQQVENIPQSAALDDDWGDTSTDTSTGTPWQIAGSYERAWRIEVTGNGKYFMFRRGSRAKRESMYGGKFYEIKDPVRRAEYYANRDIYHQRRQAAKKRRNSGDDDHGDDERPILHA